MSHNTAVSSVLNTLGGVYRDPTRVYTDTANLLNDSVGRYLRPQSSSLMEDNGTHHPSLFVLQGTIPIVYRNNTYNIPVDIFLPPPYPMRPPVCFVRPVATMMVKEKHRHVGRDGTIYMPFLHEWRPNARTHNLVKMVQTMVAIFGDDPPVFAKPVTAPAPTPTPAATPAYTTTTTTTSNNTHTPPAYDAVSAAIAASQKEAEERRQQLQLEQASIAQAEQESREQAALAQTTSETRDALTQRMHAHLAGFRSDLRASVREDHAHRRDLEANAVAVKAREGELRERVETLTEVLTQVDEGTMVLRKWTDDAAKESQGGVAGDGDDDAALDNLVVPGDVWSQQMMDLASENAAIDDCLYYLDRALVKGTIEMDVHIKKVRQLAKTQFMARALLMKVADVKVMAAMRE